MKIHFGTDGIRGPAGEEPFTPNTLRQIGQAFGQALLSIGGKRILIGRDTRESSTWIEVALLEGLFPMGIEVWHAGVVPTAAISCATAELDVDMGLMITASHNPWTDNGIKCFGPNGKKISDRLQTEVERWLNGEKRGTTLPEKSQTPAFKHEEVLEIWRRYMPQLKLDGLNIIIDAANGASWQAAPEVLEALGATVHRRGCLPNGRNINKDVGALHPPTDLLWLLRNATEGPLVGTIMSNQGLEEQLNGRLLRAKVGDRYVAELMKQNSAAIGGEASGHILFSDGMPTGDGLYAALRVLQAAGHPPWNNERFIRWPTAQSNIRFRGEKIDLTLLHSIKSAEESGHRTVVRYSGTEPKLRILVEGASAQLWMESIKEEFLSFISS